MIGERKRRRAVYLRASLRRAAGRPPPRKTRRKMKPESKTGPVSAAGGEAEAPMPAADFRDAARRLAGAALGALAAVAANGSSDSARVSAANAILDRGYGKPTSGTRALAEEEEDGPLEVRWLNGELL